MGHTFERDREQHSKYPVGFEVPDWKVADGYKLEIVVADKEYKMAVVIVVSIPSDINNTKNEHDKI